MVPRAAPPLRDLPRRVAGDDRRWLVMVICDGDGEVGGAWF